MSEAMTEMPRYRSHKTVWALKIARVEPLPNPDKTGQSGASHYGAILIPEDGSYAPITVDAGYQAKHNPQAGGYYVAYADGYKSFSPAKVFEEGNTLETDVMTFGTALELLKKGAKVARAGWNGKGMWLSMSGPIEGRLIPSTAFWSKNNADYASQQSNDQAVVLPCITMKTADGCILMGWLASQTDMLAEDWVVVL